MLGEISTSTNAGIPMALSTWSEIKGALPILILSAEIMPDDYKPQALDST